MKKKAIPAIHVPIQNADGSMQWVWYMFFQWIAENAGAADLSDYFTKEEVNALLDEKVTITDEADKIYGTDNEGEQYFYDLSYFAADDNVVHKSGDENINGIKTFNNAPRLKNNLTPSTTATKPSVIEDILLSTSENTNGRVDGVSIIRYQKTDGKREVRYRAGFRNTTNTGNLWPSVNVGVNPDDTTYVDLSTGNNDYNYAKTPTDSDAKDIQIATTLWAYRNRSTYTTNCITEIPQDINLILSSAGQLRLLAGSKLYVPNGSGVFTEKTTTTDATRAASLATGQYVEVALYNKSTLAFVQLFEIALSKCCSGTTDALAGTAQHLWYDTTNNLIKYYGSDGTTNSYYSSFPLCIISGNGTQISSIDQIFNGIGYIGSSVYILPGVKCLAPYGRTANGTLRSYEWTCSSVVIRTETSNGKNMLAINCGQNLIGWADYVYNEKENYNYSSGTISDRRCLVGSMTIANGKIENLSIDSTFHAADFNKTANTDLSNLTNIGKNIGNWSNNVTNCITEIPQDINLTLSNGTLTLKAGSKIHMADGNLNTTTTIAADITRTSPYNGQFMLILYGNAIFNGFVDSCLSGTIANRPSSTVHNAGMYFATDENKIYVTNNSGATWIHAANMSMPFAIITVSNGAISSIDQVFNGFGYIGSTVFILPGVKGLIPNGRNADGTLNNKISYNSTTVKTITPATGARYICLSLYSVYADTPLTTDFYYDETKNMNFRTSDGVQREYAVCGTFTQTNSGITNFLVKTAFHAVDYYDLEQKQDEATAVNYDNITNCITEIPQDINLTLSDGKLTLTAGSRFYYPNGSGSFGIYTLVNNMVLTLTNYGTQSNIMLFVNAAKTGLSVEGRAKCYSGSTAPTGFTGYAMWYDTTNNQIKRTTDGGSTWTPGVSFPLATITSTSNVVTSIDQVFNGIGYIGSTVFVLPGVKGLIPNGRNADGTLKNTSFTTSSVLTNTLTITLSSLTNIRISGTTLQIGSLVYDETYNYNRISAGGNTRALATAGYITTTSGGKITSFSTKYAFHAVDYNDFNQTRTDLNQLSNDAVKKSGNQSIDGIKTFSSPIDGKISTSTSQNYSSPLRTKFTLLANNYDTPSTTYVIQNCDCVANDNSYIAWASEGRNTSGESFYTISARNRASSSGGNRSATMGIYVDNSGNGYGYAPNTDRNNSILTTVAKNKAQNGYFKLGNGLIIQWGQISTTGNSRTITFPTAFTSTDYIVVANPIETDAAGNYALIFDKTSSTTTTATIKSTGHANTVGFGWIAIGY